MILIKMITEFNASIIQSKGNGGEKRRHLLCSAKKKKKKQIKTHLFLEFTFNVTLVRIRSS